jgi:hypothetical protein
MTDQFWPWEIDPGYEPHQRASALYGARTCNASMFLAQALRLKDRDTSNAYTGIGTIGHKWLELRIQCGPDVAEMYLTNQKDAVPDDFSQALEELWEWLGESGLLMRDAEHLTEERVEFQAGTCLITGHIDLIQVLRTLGVVCDWKFYNNLSRLPPIEDDLQMVAYAVGAALLVPELEYIQVHRVACYQLKSEMIEFNRPMLELAQEAIKEEAEKIWANRTTFTPGEQCLSCLLRRACPAYSAHEMGIDTTEIVPYKGGAITTSEDVLRFMVAAQVVAGRIKEGEEACREWVRLNGKLEDPSTKKLWGPWPSRKDTIMDPAAALGKLGKLVGSVDDALKAAKTTKTAMEAVMKEKNLKSKDRRAFFDGLRSSGVMEKQEQADRWEWRNPPRASAPRDS